MNKQKLFKYIFSGFLAFVMVALVVGTAAAFIIIPIVPFSDVPYNHWAVDYIWWLKNNGISVGYPDGTFRPNNNITRAEMAVMLKKTASTLVAAGVHVKRGAGDAPVIDHWFNHINGTAPTVSGAGGNYTVDFKFELDDKFMLCTVDNNYVVTRDAVCTVYIHPNDVVFVDIFDNSEGGLRAGEFWVLVYGMDMQP